MADSNCSRQMRPDQTALGISNTGYAEAALIHQLCAGVAGQPDTAHGLCEQQAVGHQIIVQVGTAAPAKSNGGGGGGGGSSYQEQRPSEGVLACHAQHGCSGSARYGTQNLTWTPHSCHSHLLWPPASCHARGRP